MRRRPPPVLPNTLWRTLVERKRIGATSHEILRDAARDGGCEHGTPPWEILFRNYGGHLRARLSIGGRPAINLDYHERESKDGRGGIIPPGYHWDVWQPVADVPIKIHVIPQPRYAWEALELVQVFWYLELEDDSLLRLF